MQINRLFEMIYILLDEKKVTAKELANRFEISTRTVYRDIETLSSAGVPIYMSKGRGGGISLLPSYTLDKTVFTKEEKSDVLLALKAMSSVGANESDSALKKLSTLFGKANTNWLEVELSTWSHSPNESENFDELKNAVISKNIVCFEYSNTKGESIYRKVEPLKLCFKGTSWYLYGFCKTRNDYRFFKLNRMRLLTVLDEVFKRPIPPQVLPQNYWEEQGATIKLKLKISPAMAFRVYDEFPSFEKNDDGSFIVTKEMPQKNDWLYSYLFSFGEHCEVLEPVEVRSSMKEKLKQCYGKYL